MSKKLYLPIIALMAFFLSASSFAMINYAVEREAEYFKAKRCVAIERNFCVNDECQTSNERDCQDRCEDGAYAVCEVETYR